MKKLAAVLGLIAAGCSPEFVGDHVGQVDSEIVNGTKYTGHPAAVYVDLGGGACTGTLISPSIVLTAKHCTEGMSYKSISVMFGNDVYGSGKWINAIHYENNPKGYSGGPGDLALITLTSPGPTDPIPVNKMDPNGLMGIQVHIVGFGVTSEYGSDSGVKRHGWTSLVDVEPGLVYTSVKPSSTCYGDSGGPNFITVNGVEYVLAATSFGTSACGFGLDASARTDDAIVWIEKYVSLHEKFGWTCQGDGHCVSGCGAPDPDCPCATDGFCAASCSDLKTDVDCKGCEADGVCRKDCPVKDADCDPPPPPDPQPPPPVDEGAGGSTPEPPVVDPEEKMGPEAEKQPRRPLLWVGCSISESRDFSSAWLLLTGLLLGNSRRRFNRVAP